MMTMTVTEVPWLVDFEKVELRLTSGYWSDCTFVVGPAEPNEAMVPAHKLILAMASSHFEEMFYGGHSEHNESIIPISDVKPEVFRSLIKYIYTGKINITSFDMARELWLEAKKYKLPHLEKKCKSYVCSVVGPRNACPVYEFASQIGEKTLLDTCIQIISANTKEVLNDRSFVDAKLDTVLKLLSLDQLNVDSELDLFRAVAKYDEAQRRPRQSSCPPADSADGGPPAEELSESVEPPISEDKSADGGPHAEELSESVEPPISEDKSADGGPPAEELSESVEPPISEDKSADGGPPAKELSESVEPPISEDKSADGGPPAKELSESVEPPISEDKSADGGPPAEELSESVESPISEDKSADGGPPAEELSESVEPPISEDKSADEGPPAEELSESVEPPISEDKNGDGGPPAEELSESVEPPISEDKSADGGPLAEELSESVEPPISEDKTSVLNGESGSQNSPTVELDSKKPSEEVVTAEPPADSENLEEEVSIQEAIKKIRFLSLTATQFAQGPALSELLTKDQKYAVLMNISMGTITTPMPTGFSESWQQRQQRQQSNVVDKEPNAKPHLKPITECFFDFTKSPTTATILWDLASSDQEKLKAATRSTRILTADDASFEIAWLVRGGVIPLLVAVLNQSWTGMQYDAAWALTNIAQEHKYTNAVVDGGAVPKLLSLLDRGGALAEQAALALGHISQSKRSALVNVGAITAIVTHMTPSTPSRLLVNCLWTYGNICEHETQFVLVATALPYIKNLLVLNNEQVLVEACSVLFYLTSEVHRKTYCFNAKLFTPELTARLTALLKHAVRRVQAAALKVLENMMVINELKKQCLGGFLDHIINLLKCGKGTLVERAARAVADLLRGKPHHIKQALDKGILDALVPALTEGNERCKAQAVIAVSAVYSYGWALQLRELAYGAVLKPYCQLLADTENSYDVLRGLSYLLQNIGQNARDALCLKLQEFGVPKLLISMQEHEDELVRERADHLLKIM